MTAGAVAMAALPLATISFLGLSASATATMLLKLTHPVFAAAALFFTTLLMIGCFARARALVVIRANEIELAERDETVSLLLREFEDKAADWLWETDAARRVVRASPRFAWATGHDPVTINGKPFLQLLAGEAWDSGKFSSGLHQLVRPAEGPRRVPRPAGPGPGQGRDSAGGRSPPARATTSAARSSGFRGVGSDVTEARASADQINRMARYDTLTGLPNRLLLNETLGARDGRCRQMGLALRAS